MCAAKGNERTVLPRGGTIFASIAEQRRQVDDFLGANRPGRRHLGTSRNPGSTHPSHARCHSQPAAKTCQRLQRHVLEMNMDSHWQGSLLIRLDNLVNLAIDRRGLPRGPDGHLADAEARPLAKSLGLAGPSGPQPRDLAAFELLRATGRSDRAAARSRPARSTCRGAGPVALYAAGGEDRP
jgi:hypothetical protein